MSTTTLSPLSSSTSSPTVNDTINDMADTLEALKTNVNQFFLIVNGMIVFFLQCGFAFLECGSVRSKNATNILIKNMLDAFVGGISYWALGYAFAYGEPSNFFIGYNYFFSTNLPDVDFASWFFQFVFAATASTIVSGALAERCNFSAYLTYSFVITGVVYPVVTHWVWTESGWLAQGSGEGDMHAHYDDFAGSGVVHLVGGVCAFMGAWLLGPRKGRFDENGKPQTIRGHSVPLAALGGFILIFGFFAFNGGSQLSISEPGDGEIVALSVVNTIISASFAAFVGLLVNRVGLLGNTNWSLLITLNCSLTGMVSICAGCEAYWPWAAAIIGAVAALVYVGVSYLVLKLKVDDPLDAVAVHAGGGLWGVLAKPFFKRDVGILYTGSQQSFLFLAWNIGGAIAITCWCVIICGIMFGILKAIKQLRVPEALEDNGLDIAKHGEPAYPVQSYGHGWENPRDNHNDSQLKRRWEVANGGEHHNTTPHNVERKDVKSNMEYLTENPEINQSFESGLNRVESAGQDNDGYVEEKRIEDTQM